MRKRTRVVLLAGLLSGCQVGSGGWEVDGCTETELKVQDVRAHSADQLVVTATLLTKEGRPVADQVVDIFLKPTLEAGGENVGGRSDRRGIVTTNLSFEYGRDPFLTPAVNTAHVLDARFISADLLSKGKVQYCASKDHATFDFDGPRKSIPG